MELKRILARDSRSANEKAIQLYGPDVLIISTQRLDQQIELIVAVDVCPAPLDVADAASAAKPPSSPEPMAADDKPCASEFTPFSQVFEQANKHPVNFGAQASGDDAMDAGALQKLQPLPLETPMPALNGLTTTSTQAVDAVQISYEQQRNHEIVDLLRQEMAALRKEFALSRQMQSWQPVSGLSAELLQLSQAMTDVGMPAGLRALLTDSIQGLDTLNEAWPVINRILTNALKQPRVAIPDKGVHALCGPTGSGKTSMLGRLAYAAAQAHGAEQQVIISFADQRPGAWSQIQLLAAQAGATCFRARDLSVLQTLLDELQGKTVWIDTPGIDFAACAVQLLQQNHGMSLHAVLPVDATVTNVQKIVQKSEIPWASLMLTKMDEAAYPWPLIQSLCDQRMAISCVSEGHQTQTSPAAFDPQRLVSLAMAPLHAMCPVSETSNDVLASPAKTPRKPRVSKPAPEQAMMPSKPRVRARGVKTETTAKAA